MGDHYDVNVGDSAETAEYCGFCEPQKAVSGLMFHLRSRSAGSIGPSARYVFCLPPSFTGEGELMADDLPIKELRPDQLDENE
jgi:hypothetical protein